MLFFKNKGDIFTQVFFLFLITNTIDCLSQDQNQRNSDITSQRSGREAFLLEKAFLKERTVNEELSPRVDTSEDKNLTVKDLLRQFSLKKAEYCTDKINDLDDFPVEPASMCCDLNFMNVDPKKGKVHYGFDIPLRTGTTLKCPDREDCLVIRSYPEWITRNGIPRQSLYGVSLLVYFKKAGYFGFYAHLKKVKGHQGRIFKHNDVMALSGNTGSLSTGAHLHFAIFRNQDCSNGIFEEKMRLAVLDTIEEIKIFEAREHGLDVSDYNIEDRSASDILKRCKVKLNQEANRACIIRNFPRDFIDPMEVTSDQTIQKLVLEINPKRMREREVLKLFTYHKKVRNGGGIHGDIRRNGGIVPTRVGDLQDILRDINPQIIIEELYTTSQK